MKVLVDTSIWSLVLRRRKPDDENVKQKLIELVQTDRAVVIGAVRQELLSGVRDKNDFERLRTRLREFRDWAVETDDYELAAEFFNRCRRSGVQGSFVDFLICAMADRRKWSIFTSDNDFQSFARFIPIKLLLV